MADAPPLIRKLLGNIATYGIGDILTKATVFITLPIYTRLLSVSEFGTWNLILTTSGIIQAILALGGDVAYLRFYFTAKTDAERQLITSTWFGFLAVWSVSIILLCLFFAKTFSYLMTGTDSYAAWIVLALINLPLGLMSSLCAQVLVNQFNARSAVRLNVLTTVLSITFSIAGAIGYGLMGFFLAMLATNLIILTTSIISVRKLLRPRFSASLLKQMLRYGIPIVPASLAFWVFASSDRVLLSNLSSLEQVGLYAIANQVANLMNMLISSLQQAWTPQAVRFTRHRWNKHRVSMRKLCPISCWYLAWSLYWWRRAGRSMIILSSAAYHPAAQAIGPLALGFVFYASAQVTFLGISLKKKTVLLGLVPWGAALINIVLNLIFIPRFGFMATAWSTTIAYAALTLTYLVASQRYFPVQYEWRRAIVLITFTTAFVIGVSFIPELDLLPSIALKIVYILIYLVLLVALGALDEREYSAIANIVRQLRTKVAQ